MKDDFVGFLQTSESILPHLGSDIEWLIVDGSGDQQVSSWYEEYAHIKNISYNWQSPEGIYHAMNQGINLAKGDWLWFINASDMVISGNSLFRIKALLNGSFTAKIIATPVVYLTPKGKYFKLVKPYLKSIDGYKIAGFHHQGVFTSRSVFEKIGSFDTNLKYASDGKFLDAAVASFDYSLTNIIACGFRMGGRSMQNFIQTISEANDYRPNSKSKIAQLLFLKNSIRKILITFEDSIIVNVYLRNRHERIAKELVALDSNFVPVKITSG